MQFRAFPASDSCSGFFGLVLGCFGHALHQHTCKLPNTAGIWSFRAVSGLSCGAFLGPVLGFLGLSWAVLGLSWAVLGLSWAVLGLSWAVLGLSWAVLGLSWAVLGLSLGITVSRTAWLLVLGWLGLGWVGGWGGGLLHTPASSKIKKRRLDPKSVIRRREQQVK